MGQWFCSIANWYCLQDDRIDILLLAKESKLDLIFFQLLKRVGSRFDVEVMNYFGS